MADATAASGGSTPVPLLKADTPAVLKLRIVSSGDGEGELNLESSARAVLVLCEPSQEDFLVRGPRIVLRMPRVCAGSDEFGFIISHRPFVSSPITAV